VTEKPKALKYSDIASRREQWQAELEGRTQVTSADDVVRNVARGILAEAHVSQATLASYLQVSQSSVSHMLKDRSYGLTGSEVFLIEKACAVRPGTIWRRVGFTDDPTAEQLVREVPGITDQTAEAIVAAIQAARAHAIREGLA
jgi:hypothetical protein